MSKVIQLHQKRESEEFEPQTFKVFTERHLEQIPQIQSLSDEQLFNMRVVAKILPFRVNQYVIEQLIDWDNIPADPVFQLTFPQKEMLSETAFNQMAELLKRSASNAEVNELAKELRQDLNPHPAGQQALNIPSMDDETVNGLQHKYRETVLFFPSQGQTCHSYCTFCFRWAQFIGDKELKISTNESDRLYSYLKKHPEVSDLLVTGGDPMVMKTKHLEKYLLHLLEPGFEHIQNIRIGTKAISFWPHRFVTDEDSDQLLSLLQRLVKAGKHVAIMTHFNHWRELETPIAREAIKRLRATGAVLRSQSPLIRHINDSSDVWVKMWRKQIKQGIVPYYMFVERDTGAKCYFEIPLAQAWEIYKQAIEQVSGLGRTARGPSMSATPGKVEIQGVTEIYGEKVFVLRFIQARNPEWVQQPFFAKYDEKATWLDQLKPAFGEEKFFFEQ